MSTNQLGWVALLVALGCAQPTPKPTPIADAAPADVFTGAIFDCTVDYSTAFPAARTCADSGDVGACMLGYVASGTAPAGLACAARDEEMQDFAAGPAATQQQQDRAAHLRAWFRAHRMTLRGEP